MFTNLSNNKALSSPKIPTINSTIDHASFLVLSPASISDSFINASSSSSSTPYFTTQLRPGCCTPSSRVSARPRGAQRRIQSSAASKSSGRTMKTYAGSDAKAPMHSGRAQGKEGVAEESYRTLADRVESYRRSIIYC